MMPGARIRLAGAGAKIAMGRCKKIKNLEPGGVGLQASKQRLMLSGQSSQVGREASTASDHTVWSLTFRAEESQSATGLGRRLHWSADGKSLWTTVYTSYRPTSRLNVGLGRRVWTPAGGKEDGAGLGDSVAGRETPGALEVEPECERLAAGEFLNPPEPECVLSFVQPQNPRSLRPG